MSESELAEIAYEACAAAVQLAQDVPAMVPWAALTDEERGCWRAVAVAVAAALVPDGE